MPAKKPAKKRSRKRAPDKKSAVRKRAAPKASRNKSLASALAESAWAEADDALAEALVEFDELEHCEEGEARAASMAMLGQALARAARRRGLTRIGVLGAHETFDAAKHDLNALGKQPKAVRIAARGVARGPEVLRRPRVGPIPRKSRRRKSGR